MPRFEKKKRIHPPNRITSCGGAVSRGRQFKSFRVTDGGGGGGGNFIKARKSGRSGRKGRLQGGMIMAGGGRNALIPGQRATSPKGGRRYVGLRWPIVAPIVAQTALQPEVAATSLPCLVTQCLAALHNATGTACNTVTSPTASSNFQNYQSFFFHSRILRSDSILAMDI